MEATEYISLRDNFKLVLHLEEIEKGWRMDAEVTAPGILGHGLIQITYNKTTNILRLTSFYNKFERHIGHGIMKVALCVTLKRIMKTSMATTITLNASGVGPRDTSDASLESNMERLISYYKSLGFKLKAPESYKDDMMQYWVPMIAPIENVLAACK